MGIVYRARDRLSGNILALKMVTVIGSKLDFASKFDGGDFNVALAQEFRTLATVRHPYVISVLDYGFHFDYSMPQFRLPYFTMEYLENAQTITEAARGLDSDQKLRLILQMVQAVAYLHRRGIIHRDLKPDNVVVISKEGDKLEVKVLDFGLAIAREEAEEVQAGTLAYMSPELLQGGIATEASDLWAIGIMMLEMLVGRHPYNVDDISELINNIVNESIDLSEFELDAELCELIGHLLERDPKHRSQDAQAIIQTMGKMGFTIAVHETETIRESFLQAARFVGREKEIDLLNTALQRIVQAELRTIEMAIITEETEYAGPKLGSVWLIGGESGVGKTRLLEELRSHALVEGALVLRGFADSDSSLPYQIWQNVLRLLCLQIELSPLELSTLKHIVPDIDAYQEKQAVTPMPASEFMANQTLLLKTVEMVFRRQERPVVVILENLHWAQDESVNLLKHMTRVIDSMRVMILASYRSDEHPELQDRLPTADLIELDRLPRIAIAALSESMLGPLGRDRRVVDTLERETEGNILFIVEAVRALAEETGELTNIGRKTLPEKIFAQGMQSVIKRRLDGVPEEARHLLYIAAIVGRELDLDLLQAVDSPMDFGDWLFVGEMAVILEVREGQWQFVHDKLREGLLAELTNDEYHKLHSQVAELIEKQYPDDPEQHVRLARLWREAGDYARELPYNLNAAQELAAKEDYTQAMTLFERAMELIQGSEQRPEDQVTVYAGIGQLYVATRRYSQAEPFLMEGLKVAETAKLPAHQAMILQHLGEMKLHSGQPLAQVEALYQKSLTIRHQLNEPFPLALAHNNLANVYVRMKKYDMAHRGFESSINLAQRADEISLVAKNWVDLGKMKLQQNHFSTAQEYFERGLSHYTTLGKNTAVTETLLHLAQVALQLKDYGATTTYVHNAIELAQSLENIHFMVTAIDLQAEALFLAGHNALALEYLMFTVRYADHSEMAEERRAELMVQLKELLDADTHNQVSHRAASRQLDEVIQDLFLLDTP